MFSKKGAKLLEGSATEHSYGSTSNQGAENPEFSASAPTVLEPSKHTSGPPKPINKKTIVDSDSPPINPWRTLVTCSCPELSTSAPVRTSDQSNNCEQLDMQEELVGVMQSTNCSAFLRDYKNAAIRFRNSKYVFIFQLLFSLIPGSALIMGCLFVDKCIGAVVLPYVDGLMGVNGIALTGVWVVISNGNRRGQHSSDAVYTFSFFLFVIFLMVLMTDICVFGRKSVSFDPQAPNYCDRTFYYYTFYKEIAIGVFAVLATVLYLPGCLHCLRCHHFSRSSNDDIDNRISIS